MLSAEFKTKKQSVKEWSFHNTVPCFTPGTRIATPKGERPVESLQVGDRVLTRDHGIQDITWIGHRGMSAIELKDTPKLRPILIPQGSLGNGKPERDMLVSPMHRMLVVSSLARRLFGEREVLVTARDLCRMEGIRAVKVPETTYIHFMCDAHQVVLANGSWTESFQPNDYALKGVVKGQRDELLKVYPELASARGRKGFQLVRRALGRVEAMKLFK